MTLNGSPRWRANVLLCPKCGYDVNRTAMLEGETVPVDGDLSVCVACAAVSVFEEDMTVLRLATPEEQDNPEVKAVIATVLESWR